MGFQRAYASDDEIQETISQALRELKTASGVTRSEIAKALQLNESSLARSMQQSPVRRREWKARDVARLAAFFDVDASVFFDPHWQLRSQHHDKRPA